MYFVSHFEILPMLVLRRSACFRCRLNRHSKDEQTAALSDSPECLLFIRTLGFPDVRSRPYFIVVMTEILIPFQFTHF